MVSLDMPLPGGFRRRAALIAAACIIAAAAVYSVAWMYYTGVDPDARLGVTVDYRFRTSDMLVSAVHPGTPAARAGLQPGDRIVGVNGRALDTPNPFSDAVTRGHPGDIVTLQVVRGSEAPFALEAALERRPAGPPIPSAQMFVFSLIRLYPVAFLTVAALVLLQRPQDRAAWLLALLFISLIASAPIEEELIHPALRGFAVGFKLLTGLVPAAVYYFFAVFPVQSPIDRRVPWLKTLLLGTASAVVGALMVWVVPKASLAPIEAIRMHGSWRTVGPLLALYPLGTVTLGLASLILNDRHAPSREARRKTRVIAWGMVVGLTPIMLLQAIAGAAGRNPYVDVPFWIWTPAVFALSLIPLSFAYAVVKYRVLEIPVLLRRSARYLLVQRGFVVLLFLVSAGATVALAVELPPLLPARRETAAPVGLIAGAGLGVMLAWAGTKLHRRITERIDRAFFRNAYDARRILEDLAGRAGRAGSRGELAGALERSIGEALHPASVAVYLETDPGTLEAFGGTPPPAMRRLRADQPDLLTIASYTGAECLSPMFGRDGKIAGLLTLGPRLSEEPFSGEDRRLLASVCTQAGLALDIISMAERIAQRIEAERRAARELEIAKEVQSRLLPEQLPSLRTLACAAVCLQARAVGGDYYDFLDLGDDRLGVVLADISGKGISAALLMANLQAYVRSRYALAREDLPQLLLSLQRHLFQTTPSAHFATMFFGRYDDESRRLIYANCGHNPPLLVRAGGGREWLAPTAGALGLFESWSCAFGELSIEPGDTLVVFTDGVTEAMNGDGDFFGEDRLVDVVERHADLSARKLLDAVVATVTQFSGPVQEDDLTLIVLRGLR